MSKYHKPQKLSAKPPKFSKHHLRADGLLLLSSALRSCLGRRTRPAVLGALAVIAGGVAATQSTDASAESLTLTIPSTPLTLDITPTAEGQFGESNPETVSVETDSLAGYTLTIKSQNGVSDLVNGDSSGKITSIAEKTSYQSGFTANSWGYQPSKFSSQTNTAYLPGPKSGPDIIDATTAKTSKTNYTIKLGAKVDTSIPYGTYSNTFVLTATANLPTYSVTFNLQGGDAGTGPDDILSRPSETNTVSIPADKNPTRPGYEFVSWCNQQPTQGSNGVADTCGGQTYTRDDSSTLTPQWALTGATNSLTLYAMWKSAIPTTMQGFSSSYCESMPQGSTTLSLKDTRDSNTYKVAKLKDNKCWMVENLRYKTSAIGTDSTYGGYYTYDNARSACPTGWHLPTKDEYNSLISAYGAGSNSSLLMTKPVPGFVYAGNFNYGSLYYEGNGGYYSSSTAASGSDYVYIMELKNSGASIDTGSRDYGFSVRCVAQQ